MRQTRRGFVKTAAAALLGAALAPAMAAARALPDAGPAAASGCKLRAAKDGKGGAKALGQKIVIAHRGASGYLPEHTLEAKALAYGLSTDYLEQDLVMTKDDQLIVLHDHYLDRVTDAAEKFPRRARADGRWYAIDFTLTGRCGR